MKKRDIFLSNLTSLEEIINDSALFHIASHPIIGCDSATQTEVTNLAIEILERTEIKDKNIHIRNKFVG